MYINNAVNSTLVNIKVFIKAVHFEDSLPFLTSEFFESHLKIPFITDRCSEERGIPALAHEDFYLLFVFLDLIVRTG